MFVLRGGPGAISGIGLMAFLFTNNLLLLVGALAVSVVLAHVLYLRSKSLVSKYAHEGHFAGPAHGGRLGETPPAATQSGARTVSPAAGAQAPQGILDSFGVDAVARGKVLRLSLLVPPVAVFAYLALYLACGAGAMVRVLIGVVAVLAFIEAACAFYGKVARLITLPEVPFSDMSSAGQKLVLAAVAALFLAIGVLLGLMVYAILPASFRDFVLEFRNALRQFSHSISSGAHHAPRTERRKLWHPSPRS